MSLRPACDVTSGPHLWLSQRQDPVYDYATVRETPTHAKTRRSLALCRSLQRREPIYDFACLHTAACIPRQAHTHRHAHTHNIHIRARMRAHAHTHKKRTHARARAHTHSESDSGAGTESEHTGKDSEAEATEASDDDLVPYQLDPDEFPNSSGGGVGSGGGGGDSAAAAAAGRAGVRCMQGDDSLRIGAGRCPLPTRLSQWSFSLSLSLSLTHTHTHVSLLFYPSGPLCSLSPLSRPSIRFPCMHSPRLLPSLASTGGLLEPRHPQCPPTHFCTGVRCLRACACVRALATVREVRDSARA